MKKITDFIVNKRIIIITIFIFLTITSTFLSKNVKIVYDMKEYLPSDSTTKIGMNIMDQEFEKDQKSNLKLMFKNLTEEEKQKKYEELLQIQGISSIDYEKESEEYNKDEYTLFIINVDEPEDSATAIKIYNQVNDMYKEEEFCTSGNISERNKKIIPSWILILVVIVCAIILIVMCESYIEPFLFLLCIGIAILLNNGTNIIFKSVSNITSSISAVLQLALSMDYSIMLINRYRQEKEKNESNIEAMKETLYKAFLAISSSSLTTIVGLMTLVFMSFTIGKDLGLVLAKGVLLSLLVIFTCLPALILMFDKIIQKTKKKSFNITLNKFGNIIYKCRGIGLILLIILFVGSYMLKGNLNIIYTAENEDKIATIFPKNNQIAIIYNNKDEAKVSSQLSEIEEKENVKEVLAYGNTIGEKLKYNEFNPKLEDLGTDTRIENYLLKIIYYNYFNENQETKMTFNEFVDFTEKDVLSNQDLSSKLDENIETNIKRLKKFTSEEEMNKKRNYTEIAETLEINKNDAYNLFVYYYKDKINTTLTLSQFINFINNEVLSNKEYSSSIAAGQRKSLKDLSKFLNKDTINKNMNYAEMANLFSLDKNAVQNLYLYHCNTNEITNKLTINEFSNFIIENVLNNKQYSNKFDEKTIANLKQLQTISNKNIINQNMGSSKLSEILGIEKETINKLLLIGYMQETGGTQDYTKINPDNLKQTPFNIIKFIIENSKNEQISSNINMESLAKLQNAYKIMNSANNNEKYNYGQISNIVGIDNNTTKSIYALYVSSKTEIKITPTNFVKFILKNKDDQNLKGSINNETLNKLKTLNTVIDGVNSNKKYSSSEISNVLGLEKEDTKILYSLYSAKHNNIKMNASLKEFVNFILKDIMKNKKYSNKFNSEKITKLNTINGIMNAVINKTEYNPRRNFYNYFKINKQYKRK